MRGTLPDRDAIAGCLLGTAYGDALGLPYEGLSARRAARLLGPPTRYRLILGRGMISDDTEHAIMVALALGASRGDPDRFARALAHHLRLWFLALPAGMGLATGRAIMKLLVGFPPSRSGVFSAGNGPAMRVPLIGVVASDLASLRALVEASTIITHRDPKALHGALAVALAARASARGEPTSPPAFVDALTALVDEPGSELVAIVGRAASSVGNGENTAAFARALGLERGVSGYVLHTVPICLHAWLSHRADLPAAVRAVIECGGDADTTAAIVGGIVGAGLGPCAVPERMRARLVDWPWGTERIERLAGSLAHAMAPATTPGEPFSPPRPLWLARLPRNLVFLVIVLAHGFRRLAPPY